MDDQNLKETLIELVRNEPVLWNQLDGIYKSKKNSEKTLMWAKFAGILNLPDAPAVKAIWKSLRDQFTRELKKCVKWTTGMEMNELDDDDLQYQGSWHFFSSLLFLRRTVTPRKTSGNLDKMYPKKPDNNAHGNIDEILVEVETISDANDSIVENSFNDTPHSSQTSFGSRKRKHETALQLEEQKLNLFSRKLLKEERNEDADLCFLKGLLPEIKKAKKPAKLKLKILEVIDQFLDQESE